jgi:hypothetical protein
VAAAELAVVPDGHGTVVGVAPEDVVLAVEVEIAGAVDAPRERHDARADDVVAAVRLAAVPRRQG